MHRPNYSLKNVQIIFCFWLFPSQSCILRLKQVKYSKTVVEKYWRLFQNDTKCTEILDFHSLCVVCLRKLGNEL